MAVAVVAWKQAAAADPYKKYKMLLKMHMPPGAIKVHSPFRPPLVHASLDVCPIAIPGEDGGRRP